MCRAKSREEEVDEADVAQQAEEWEVLGNFLRLTRASKLAERERLRAQLELISADLRAVCLPDGLLAAPPCIVLCMV